MNAEKSSVKNGTELLTGVLGANDKVQIEMTYVNGIPSKMRRFDSSTMENEMVIEFDRLGKRSLELVTTQIASSRTEYVNGVAVYSEFSMSGDVVEKLDTRGGKLNDWQRDRIDLWLSDSNRIQSFRVNAKLKISGILKRTAELVTDKGVVLAKAEMKNGNLNGAYVIYDPEFPSLPMVKGQFKNGVNVGRRESGLSRPNLEKDITEFDNEGRWLSSHRPGFMNTENIYDQNGNQVAGIYTRLDKPEASGAVFDPFSHQTLAGISFDRDGKAATTHRYSRITGKASKP